MRRSFILHFVSPPVYFFVNSDSIQPNVTALGWPQTVCKTGSITTFSHSCTSGQDGQTHAKSPKCAFIHTHKHTRTHKHLSASLGCCNRILESLKIKSDMWHEWLMSLSNLDVVSVRTTFEQLSDSNVVPDAPKHNKCVSTHLSKERGKSWEPVGSRSISWLRNPLRKSQKSISRWSFQKKGGGDD